MDNTEPRFFWLEQGDSKIGSLSRAGIAADAKVTFYSWLSGKDGECKGDKSANAI